MRQEYVNLSGSFDAVLTEISSLKAENTDLRNKATHRMKKLFHWTNGSTAWKNVQRMTK